MATRKAKTTRTNSVAPERLEDAFFDLPISEQAIMLRTLNTLHRLACRQAHLNRDIAPKLPPPPDGESTEEMAARMAQQRQALQGAQEALANAYGKLGPLSPDSLVAQDIAAVEAALALAEGK